MTMPLAITLAESAPEAAPFVLRNSFNSGIREAAAIGFDAVELHAPDPARLDLGMIERCSVQYGIAIGSLGTGMAASQDGLTLVHVDSERRVEAAKRMRGFIDIGARFGSVVIVGLIRGLARDCGGRSEYMARLRPAMSELLGHAEKQEVTLVLEAVNRYESDVFNTVLETSGFIAGYGSDRLKLHVDTFHMNIEEANVADSLRAAAGVVGHVHIADSNRLAPGQGHFDFKGTVATLADIGYSGLLSVECLPLPTPY
uniref:TIM barrel protein n=1 Tax=Paracoccus sp. TaxID=267 RepID=UPI00396CD0D4